MPGIKWEALSFYNRLEDHPLALQANILGLIGISSCLLKSHG